MRITIDQFCGAPAGTFKAFVKRLEESQVKAEEERKARIRNRKRL